MTSVHMNAIFGAGHHASRTLRVLALSVACVATVGIQSAFAEGATLTFSPSAVSADVNGHFEMDVVVTTDMPTRGLQFGINYDQTRIQIDRVTDGTMYSDWAKANNAQAVTAVKFTPNNQTGHVSIGGMALFGGPVDGPSGTGTVLHVSGTAKSGASGTATLEFESPIVVGISQNGMNWPMPLKPLSVGSAAIGIGSAPSFQPQIRTLESGRVHEPGPGVSAELDVSNLHENEQTPIEKLTAFISPIRDYFPLGILVLGLCGMVVIPRLIFAIPVRGDSSTSAAAKGSARPD